MGAIFCAHVIFLGRQFPQIQNYLQYIVGAMVIFSLIPIVYQQFKNRHTSDKVKKNIGMKSPQDHRK